MKGLRSELLALCFGLVRGLAFSGLMVEVGASGGLLPVWCVVSLLLAQSGYRTLVVKGGR